MTSIKSLMLFVTTLRRLLNFDDAQQNCRNKLGGKGRLVEPKTIEISAKLSNKAKSLFSGQYHAWMGVDSRGHGENNFRYTSTNITPPIPEQNVGTSLDVADQCALIVLSKNKLEDEYCWKKYMSICEFTN